MKKERIFTGLGLAALIIAASVSLAGCESPAGDPIVPGASIVTERYTTVPVRSLISAKQSVQSSRAVGGSDPYVLAYSGIGEDDGIHYYLYYLGYVKNVPIAYKTPYRYDGTTPITVTFEKSLVNEETITESTTQTKEKTTSVNASATATVGVEAEAGIIVAKVKTSASFSTTVGTEVVNAISTSNTFETAKTKVSGESESISATIGEHGEAPGAYRYALFGLTDVYCTFAVDPETREIISINYTTCARASAYAWGIDFDPNEIPVFGKTGSGDLLGIPDIDFTDIDAPTDTLEGLPKPPPPETVDAEVRIDFGNIIGDATSVSGDNNVNSKNGRHTNWEFEIQSMALINPRTDGTYDTLEIRFVYTVTEGEGDTVLRITKTKLENFASHKAVELRDPTTVKREGRIDDEFHGWKYYGPWSNGLLNYLYVKVDDSAGNDSNHIGFHPDITVRFVKKNN
jgi:hypothetical protein